MAKKPKTQLAFVCEECGAEHTKWRGQCQTCGVWNSLRQIRVDSKATPAHGGFSGAAAEVKRLVDVQTHDGYRIETGLQELDRVLGGGLVPGSVVLIGGDPGAGKSTLLLQVVAQLANELNCWYVSGEESMQQIARRARRLKVMGEDTAGGDSSSSSAQTTASVAHNLRLASLTSVDQLEQLLLANAADGDERTPKPTVVIVDSIQVMHVESVESAAGSVAQVRESAARLTQLTKQTNSVLILIGHVTKEGNLAGPKVLEHIIDCFLMLDAPAGSRYRTLRSVKNRFGAVNELGVFAMTDQGLREVRNPSAIFLERSADPGPGSVVTVIWEGTRPLLVEIQALVDDVQGGYPRRVAVGLDAQRLAMLLAVLHRHGGISLTTDDVFINVTGGVRVSETATDLASLVSAYSSFRNKPVPRDLVVFGELGLTGEIRPVPNGQERLREAQKHGFTQAIVPVGNRPPKPIPGIVAHAVHTLAEALEVLGSAE